MSHPPFRIQPLDRTAFILAAVLMVAIALLALSGDHTAPRIRDFSWQDRQVGAEDTAFLLTFSRPMNRESVEQNLKLDPPLPGKFSWAGRRMAYTLEAPAPYGTEFQLQLQGARDRFTPPEDTRRQMPLFTGRFQTRDRAFVYLGVQGEEAGRLVLENLTRKEHRILTPANLVVMDYEPYPEGDRILFSASDRSAEFGALDQQIYTVTTGVQPLAPAKSPDEMKTGTRVAAQKAQPPGIVTVVLDSRDYQNLKFDLAPNGEFLIVQRVNRKNPADFGLWFVREGQPPQPIQTEPGGDFLITPDSASIAMAQGQGMAILPLATQEGVAGDPLDFLPRFGMVLNFSQDGAAAAMVKFNPNPDNPTRSLFLVTSTGVEKELFQTTGSILMAQFDPTKTLLYCLVTVRLPGDTFVEQPYIVAVNLENLERTKLLELPIQRDVQMSLAPDGLGILFDQVVAAADDQQPTAGAIQGSDGKAIASSRLWFLPLVINESGNPNPVEAKELPLRGLRPRWLP